MKLFPVLAALLSTAALSMGAPRWQMQYFYDENRTSLEINDIAFPSPRRGVAVGQIVDDRSHTRGTAVVSSDGGAHWALVPLPDTGVSVFFLDDSMGWVVTPKGIFQTEEGGRSWRKLPSSPKGAMRVWFFNPQHGYAVGFKKSIWETLDGGKQWKRIPASDSATSNPKYTVYNEIAFAPDRKMGMIVGASRPPRREDFPELPDWMEPEKASARREWPTMMISLATADGGANWQASTTSIFGQVGRVRLGTDGLALLLVELRHGFPYASEVYALHYRNGNGRRVFRDKDRVVTDLAFPHTGPVYLAAIESPGKVLRLPIPGKLHVLKSSDLKQWTEMKVDYRASAQRAVMAAADAENIFVATDTGMILKLVP